MSAGDPGRPSRRPVRSRRVHLVDLDGRLTIAQDDLLPGETLRAAAQRLLGPAGFQVHMIRGTSHQDRGAF